MKRLTLILGILVFIVGCTSSPLSNMQRRSLEAKELQGNYEDAFKATLQVLQDSGYAIVHSDFKGGVIKGDQGWQSRGILAPEKYEISVVIEDWSKGLVKERLTIMKKRDMGLGSERSWIVEDYKVIQEMYDNIQKEIFVRQNLSK